MRTPSSLVADSRGQSLVETVVMLPVLLALFLGLYYFSGMVRVRMQAIEASRYVTWEYVWNVRDKGEATRDPKGTDVLRTDELKKVGLDPFLMHVARNTRSIADYSDQTTSAPTFAAPPQIIGEIFDLGSVPDVQGALDGAASALSALLDIGAKPSNFAIDLMARETNWDDEASKAVYSSLVIYSFHGGGFFRKLPAIKMREFSSILTHPLNIVRTGDDKEYEALVGTTDLNFCENPGHIFPLLFPPSGPIADNPLAQAASAFLSGGKCFFTSFGKLASGLDSIIGTSTGFRIPDGTLKEFPELRDTNGGSD